MIRCKQQHQHQRNPMKYDCLEHKKRMKIEIKKATTTKTHTHRERTVEERCVDGESAVRFKPKFLELYVIIMAQG